MSDESLTGPPDIGRIDLEAIYRSLIKMAPMHRAYIVDMTKCEALDSLGEEKSAKELAERYL